MTDTPAINFTKNNPVLIARGVSAEAYMSLYAEDHAEWVKGDVLKLPPIHHRHDILCRYLQGYFTAYLTLNPIGVMRVHPFVMRLDVIPSRREPDIQLILGDTEARLKPAYTDGPADLCIEVVTPETMSRDYADKLTEYELGGVREYWIVDPALERVLFFRLNTQGEYDQIAPGVRYTTPLLPCFVLHVGSLWLPEPPDFFEIAERITAELNACKPEGDKAVEP